jgi:hypothetical protein
MQKQMLLWTNAEDTTIVKYAVPHAATEKYHTPCGFKKDPSIEAAYLSKFFPAHPKDSHNEGIRKEHDNSISASQEYVEFLKSLRPENRRNILPGNDALHGIPNGNYSVKENEVCLTHLRRKGVAHWIPYTGANTWNELPAKDNDVYELQFDRVLSAKEKSNVLRRMSWAFAADPLFRLKAHQSSKVTPGIHDNYSRFACRVGDIVTKNRYEDETANRIPFSVITQNKGVSGMVKQLTDVQDYFLFANEEGDNYVSEEDLRPIAKSITEVTTAELEVMIENEFIEEHQEFALEMISCNRA